ncbi:unnamed protein product [Cyprideis torosa]|uniref:Crooked neck protein n=1 Tax=Cyprideis torosa TaxID=163714 RepID=A0A7R8ZNR1_9CRUS|nr:unnamed protein product [Cyprideis torosa]CAG0888296.1 unnamed protein product [Cyprideis torosa]
MADAAGKPPRLPKVAKVKNKAPAEIQITAEQLLREAKERDLEFLPPPPKQKISDPEELAAYRMSKRKQFEDNIRKNRGQTTNWMKYAAWEESQRELQRARSVYERALDVDHRCIPLWFKYAEMEMRNKQINHARNLWDRAVTILPRANQLWYKYVYMEEMLGNIAGARAVFERWMEWQPDEQPWLTYIKFELRYKEIARARAIYERFVMTHPDMKNWIKYARFEERHGYVSSARKVFERAVEFFGEEYMDEQLFQAFAKFEENQKEHDRARTIYKYALEHIPKDKCQELYREYTIHEKKYGDRKGIEDVIINKRLFQYEQEINACPTNYDAWFDYLRILEGMGEEKVETIRETYERAIGNLPPLKGTAIGMCPKDKLFRGYIDLELQLREFDRCRILYEKFLEYNPENCQTWLKFAELETLLGDMERARSIFELATTQPRMDMPEVLWKGYIDMEIEDEQWEHVRSLYHRLLEKTKHVKVWLSYAQFERRIGEADNARRIYKEANAYFRDSGEKESRVLLLETWKAWEDEEGGEELETVKKLMPKRVKRRQKITTDDGHDAGWEEVFDYIFPEEESAKPHLKLLAMAKMWKKGKDVDEEAAGEKMDSEQPGREATTGEIEIPEEDDDKDSSSSSESSKEKDRDEEDIAAQEKAKRRRIWEAGLKDVSV